MMLIYAHDTSQENLIYMDMDHMVFRIGQGNGQDNGIMD